MLKFSFRELYCPRYEKIFLSSNNDFFMRHVSDFEVYNWKFKATTHPNEKSPDYK